MIEIRIHGRGGQGNVVAAYLLAAAAFDAGLQCQAFPAFGAERRGAPVVAFVRISETPIFRRNQVKHPAYLIIQDRTLLLLMQKRLLLKLRLKLWGKNQIQTAAVYAAAQLFRLSWAS